MYGDQVGTSIQFLQFISRTLPALTRVGLAKTLQKPCRTTTGHWAFGRNRLGRSEGGGGVKSEGGAAGGQGRDSSSDPRLLAVTSAVARPQSADPPQLAKQRVLTPAPPVDPITPLRAERLQTIIVGDSYRDQKLLSLCWFSFFFHTTLYFVFSELAKS